MKTNNDCWRLTHLIPLLFWKRFPSVALKYAVIILALAACLTAEGQVQRMHIRSGTYHVGPGGPGGSGSGTITSYCVDPHFDPPNPHSQYQYIVGGGNNCTVQLPGKSPVPLSKALEDRDVKISGGFGISQLQVEAPEGTEIKIGGPLVLSADLWLESTKTHKFDPRILDLASEHLKDSSEGARGQAQSRIWRDIQLPGIEAAFGQEGRQLVEHALKNRTFVDAKISTLGEYPVLQLFTIGPDETFPRAEIIRRENGKVIKQAANNGEKARQTANIHARLSKLATDETAFVTIGDDDKLTFTQKGSHEAKTIRLGWRIDVRAINEWLDSRKSPGKPNIIFVSEAKGWLDQFYLTKLRDVCGERARIYEDDDPVLALANVKAQRQIKSGSDVAIFADPAIQTGGVLTGVEKLLAESHIPLLTKPAIVEVGNVIVITGHKDSAYRNYLAELAMSGTLKGKAVALFSCAEVGDREFSRFLITEGGATCIFRVNDKVDSAAAREVLIKLAQQSQALPAKGKYLDELINDAVDAAVKDAVREPFKKELRIFLNHSLQVSQIEQSLTHP